MHRTFYAAGEFAFSIVSDDSLLSRLADNCLVDLRSTAAAGPEILLSVDGIDGVLIALDSEPHKRVRRDAFLASLVALLNRRSLDADPTRLHIHAAALRRSDCGVVVSATAGTGKSTLSAALAERKWTYLSDEMVAIGNRGEIVGFPKPITLRPDGARLLGAVADQMVQYPGTADRRGFLPASRVPTDVAHSADAGMLVLLRRAVDDEPSSWRQLSSASATVMAINNLFDFDRLAEKSLPIIADFCGNVLCVELTMADLKSTAELLEGIVADISSTPDWKHCAEGPKVGDVRSVLVDGEAVLHNTRNNRVVSLPAESCKEWIRDAETTSEGSSALFDELRRIEILTGEL